MTQNNNNHFNPLWQLKSRSIYVHIPIFKMKLYRYGQDDSFDNNKQKPYLFFHLPSVKKIAAYSQDLKTQIKVYKFQKDPNSFQIMNVKSQTQGNQKPYMIAGSSLGTIMCQPLIPNVVNDNIYQEDQENNKISQSQIFELNLIQKNPKQIYINDILSLGNNKIVNCFNNGTLAFWDLSLRKRILSLPNTHSTYTYKLRRIQQRLISCGHDNQVVITDMIKMKRSFNFIHQQSVWCAYPLNSNIIASVGLFNRVNIWDIRVRQLCQSSLLVYNQSSFVTSLNGQNLVLGDGPILKRCDLRTMRSITFTSENMLLSAQNIIVTQKGGYVCGRRFQICHFENVDQINLLQQGVNRIFNPYDDGEMFVNEIRMQQQQQANQENDHNDNIDMNDQIIDEDEFSEQQQVWQQDDNDSQIQDVMQQIQVKLLQKQIQMQNKIQDEEQQSSQPYGDNNNRNQSQQKQSSLQQQQVKIINIQNNKVQSNVSILLPQKHDQINSKQQIYDSKMQQEQNLEQNKNIQDDFKGSQQQYHYH